MTTFAKKTLTAAVAALSIGAAVTMSAGTAEAKGGKGAAIAGGIIAGVVGGAILGSIANANAGYVEVAPAYGSCWLEKRPVYNQWGDFMGYRRIRVCNP